MEKYKSAYKQLSASDKSAMDIEYATNRKAGKLIFNSKVTGLDYTIPENAGRKSTTSDKAAGDYNPRDYNPLMQDKIAPFSLNDPNRKFPQPAKPVIAPDRLSEITNIYNATQTPQAKEEMAAIQKTESKAPEVARGNEKNGSYIKALNSSLTFGSSAGARVISQIANRKVSAMLGAVDEAIGTKLNNKELFSQQMDEADLSPKAKSLLYKIADRKASNTGKNEGFMSYEDYEGILPDADYKALTKAKGLGGSKIDQGVLTIGSAGADLGLTVGGASFKKDPETGMIKISDSYDFISKGNITKDGKLDKTWTKNIKMDTNKEANFSTHNNFTEYDLDVDKRSGLGNRKLDFELSPQDTVGRGSKDKEASWLAKIFNKAGVKPVKKK